MPLPVYTNDQIADYLTSGFWGSGTREFNIATGGTIYVDFNGFNGTNPWGDSDIDGIVGTAGVYMARAALQVWSDATGINFVEGNGNGSAPVIQFIDAYSGAFGGSSGNTGVVNISQSFHWDNTEHYDNYLFQAYIHEIGHALGLGHGGDYDGSANYSTTNGGQGYNHYLNDSWQASVMSYFDQIENTWLTATYAYTITPMVADIIAIRNLYGSTNNTRTGNTNYGHNANTGSAVLDGWESYGNNTVMVVVDDGGEDTFDFSNGIVEQSIDLREEAFSNVYGEIGTVGISRGTIIENAIGGSGTDTIYGNDVGNFLKGKNGDDTLFGYGGADNLNGGRGTDLIYGGGGNDTIKGGGANDEIFGEGGDDTIYGGSGRDAINGGNGNDTIYGNGGGDALQGGGGDDILDGGKGNDRLIGGKGNDTMFGGDGNDKLNGQSGDDIYWGGAGADEFIFDASQDGNDIINDYGNGADSIIIRNGSAGSTSVVNDNGDAIITMGGQIITVIDGWTNGIQDTGDLIFV